MWRISHFGHRGFSGDCNLFDSTDLGSPFPSLEQGQTKRWREEVTPPRPCYVVELDPSPMCVLRACVHHYSNTKQRLGFVSRRETLHPLEGLRPQPWSPALAPPVLFWPWRAECDHTLLNPHPSTPLIDCQEYCVAWKSVWQENREMLWFPA